MAIGTAGYTAMLCVMALERNGVRPGDGPVLVTGATGGVGSIALLLLSRLGHQVVAVTGKASEAPYLRSLGATEILDRAELSGQGKPCRRTLERGGRCGGQPHAGQCAGADALWRHGRGLRAGPGRGSAGHRHALHPARRGAGRVDSVMAPLEIRNQAWQRLAKDLDLAMLER